MARAIITVPRTAKRGEIIELRALIGHIMESGFQTGVDGAIKKRDILRSFTCSYNGEQVFRAELHPAVSANPYIAFHTVATDSGTLTFRWEGDNGFSHTETAAITVAG